MTSRTNIAIALLAGALGAHAVAQERPAAPPIPLEPMVADANVLSVSLRVMEGGLGVPAGFEEVYDVPGRDDLRMRINGGLYAVFPESAYLVSGRRAVALIPAGTVFFIGEPSPEALRSLAGEFGPAGAPRRDDRGERLRIEERLRFERRIAPQRYEPLRVEALMTPSSEPPAAHRVARWSGPTGRGVTDRDEASGAAPVSIVTDAAYRARRVRALMQAAVAAEQGVQDQAPSADPKPSAHPPADG